MQANRRFRTNKGKRLSDSLIHSRSECEDFILFHYFSSLSRASGVSLVRLFIIIFCCYITDVSVLMLLKQIFNNINNTKLV